MYKQNVLAALREGRFNDASALLMVVTEYRALAPQDQLHVIVEYYKLLVDLLLRTSGEHLIAKYGSLEPTNFKMEDSIEGLVKIPIDWELFFNMHAVMIETSPFDMEDSDVDDVIQSLGLLGLSIEQFDFATDVAHDQLSG